MRRAANFQDFPVRDKKGRQTSQINFTFLESFYKIFGLNNSIADDLPINMCPGIPEIRSTGKKIPGKFLNSVHHLETPPPLFNFSLCSAGYLTQKKTVRVEGKGPRYLLAIDVEMTIFIRSELF